MKKRHVLCSLMAATLLSAAMTPAVAALNWKDGALANYYFTYTGNNGGIASVNASDTNGTFNGEVKEGQTITTKTGTIAWRDSYTNVTTFNVDVKPGYKLSELKGNVGDAKFEAVDEDTYIFHFTDKGAETILDKVSFNLITEKIPYTVNFYADGKLVNNTKIAVNDPLDFSVTPEKEGYDFAGWYVNGKKLGENATLTEDMIAAANEDNEIKVDAEFTVNAYDVTINVYDDNTTGKPVSTLDTKLDYGTVIDEAWLKANNYSDYRFVGNKGITVGTEGNVVNLVKYTDVEEDNGSYEYGFLYNSKDDGILSVEYSIDGGNWTEIDVNEGVKFTTSGWLHESKNITFRVKVDEGKKLVLDVSAGENNVAQDGEYYTFSFTRTAYQGLPGTSNIPNVSFNLSTEDVEPAVEALAVETVEAAVLVPAEEVTETVEAEVIVPAEPAAEETVEETETVEAEVIVPAETVAEETVEEVVAE